MAQPPSSDKVALGRERLAARARRISVLRRRVVASTLATFALAWGVVAFTGSMGTASTTTAQVPTATATATTSPDSSSSSSDTTTSGDSSSSAAPLTTSQS